MKKLLLACIFSIGFAQQLTAGVYDMVYDLMAVYGFIGLEQAQLEEKKSLSLDDLMASHNASDDLRIISVDAAQAQSEEKIIKITNSSLYQKITKWRVTDDSEKPSLSIAAKLMNNRQMNRQDKMFQKWQKDMPKNVQMMNSYTMNRE